MFILLVFWGNFSCGFSSIFKISDLLGDSNEYVLEYGLKFKAIQRFILHM